MEVCNGEYGDWNDKLVESIDNGKCNDWKSESNKNIPWRLRSQLNPEVPSVQNADTDADDDKEDNKITENNSVDYATGFCQQLYILIKRNAIKLSRDRVSIIIIIIESL